jgi:hypothetical protein
MLRLLKKLPQLLLQPAYALVTISIFLVLLLLEGTYPLFGFVPSVTKDELDSIAKLEEQKITSEMKGRAIIVPKLERVYEADATWAVSARLTGYMFIWCASSGPASQPADNKEGEKGKDNKDDKDDGPDIGNIGTANSPCKVDRASFSTSSRPEPFIRWDRFLFVVGLLVLCITTLFFLKRLTPVQGLDRAASSERIPVYTSLEQHLLLDVQRAFQRADALFARSSLMLISGILVAFLGIVAFAFLTSSTTNQGLIFDFPRYAPGDDTVPQYTFDQLQAARRDRFIYEIVLSVTSKFRFVLIFVFVETVAWFLLKQYRALIEDYKAFYRIYLRRQNYASSYFMLKGLSLNRSAEMLIAASMLHEDLSGTLAKGREAESWTQLEFAERNSFSSIASFIERIGQIGQAATASAKDPDEKAASAKDPDEKAASAKHSAEKKRDASGSTKKVG